MIKKALLVYPPTGLFQRGEDRSQGEIEHSSATVLRACNDLGYLASVFRQCDIEPKIVDYPGKRENWKNYKHDLETFKPNFVVASITTATIENDIKSFDLAKKIYPKCITIAKGAHFFNCNLADLPYEKFKNMDYAFYGESEVILMDFLKRGANKWSDTDGVIKWEGKNLKRNKPAQFLSDLDCIPFPARDLMNNKLYVRPDTEESQATIQTTRGCPASCIFCLTPEISGKIVRKRSIENIVKEIEECITKYNIKNFFFRADTFTIDKDWTKRLCQEIIDRKLNIKWVANSRVSPLNKETLQIMRKAGCWLTAFGFESGSPESLITMKKGTTIEDNKMAMKYAKEVGLKTYGFFLIGLPWENNEHIQQTLNHAIELDCDFYEIHIAIPYEGTKLYDICKESNLLTEKSFGHNYFTNPVIGTKYLTKNELIRWRVKILKKIYLRPRYILRRLTECKNPVIFKNYIKRGWSSLRNLFFVF